MIRERDWERRREREKCELLFVRRSGKYDLRLRSRDWKIEQKDKKKRREKLTRDIIQERKR